MKRIKTFHVEIRNAKELEELIELSKNRIYFFNKTPPNFAYPTDITIKDNIMVEFGDTGRKLNYKNLIKRLRGEK